MLDKDEEGNRYIHLFCFQCGPNQDSFVIITREDIEKEQPGTYMALCSKCNHPFAWFKFDEPLDVWNKETYAMSKIIEARQAREAAERGSVADPSSQPTDVKP